MGPPASRLSAISLLTACIYPISLYVYQTRSVERVSSERISLKQRLCVSNVNGKLQDQVGSCKKNVGSIVKKAELNSSRDKNSKRPFGTVTGTLGARWESDPPKQTNKSIFLFFGLLLLPIRPFVLFPPFFFFFAIDRHLLLHHPAPKMAFLCIFFSVFFFSLSS